MLTPLDLIIIAVIGFGMYQGARRGIFKKATAIISLILATILGWRTSGIARNLYLDYLRLDLEPQLLAFVSFATAFVVIYILASTFLGYLAAGLGKVNLKFDNALGALFGGITATLALSVGLTILAYGGFPSGTARSESVLYPYVKVFAQQTLGIGVSTLKEATNGINKFGLDKPTQDNTSPAANPPANRPKPIRP